ncbi:MAG: taurine dioxygenase [Balneolaceae bacterium]
MSKSERIIDFTSLIEMLYGETKYINEFAEAAVQSFSEFQKNYAAFLIERDEVNFRKAGHKIKPVAQMLGLQLIIDEYEFAKTLIWDKKPDSDLAISVAKMDGICNQILTELDDIIRNGFTK